MNEVLQAILDYVQTPQTHYALLITGPWGCGKTYFWKNVVEAQLRQVKCKGTPYRPLYASLYGCQSTRDIDTQLLLACHPRLRKEWTARLASVGGSVANQILKAFTRFEFPAIDLRWLISTKHAVLCFDDLERTRLPMKEALGYINTFVEHEHAKVVILCNEDGIDDEKERGIYDAMKEKVVSASLTFRPDMDAVFGTLIDEHKPRDAFHEFLSQNAKLLRHLFDRSETQNIRSLRRAISALARIFDVLRDSDIDTNKLAKQLVYAVAPTSFELHGRGVNPGELRNIHTREYMAVAGISASILRSAETDAETYEEQFAKRYLRDLGLSEWGDALGCPPICEFLVTGVLDRPTLISWAERLTKPPDETEERIKRLTSDPRDMEDEEFASTAAQVLKEVEAGEIAPVGRYVGLYNTFEWFADAGLIPMTRQELLNKFTEGLRRAKESGRLEPNPRLVDAFGHPSLAPKTDESRNFFQHAVAENEDLLKGVLRERVQALVSRLRDDPESFVSALSDEGENGLLFMPVFQELPADEVATRILDLPNPLKVRFQWAVQARNEKRVPSGEFVVELPALTQIRDALQKHCAFQKSKKPIPMSAFITQGIVEALDRAIELLTHLKQQKQTPSSVSAKDQTQKEQGGNDNDFSETEKPA